VQNARPSIALWGAAFSFGGFLFLHMKREDFSLQRLPDWMRGRFDVSGDLKVV
jgi:hypothetical protein